MALPAYAQQQVNMRTGEHRGYTRLVFDWPEAVTYKIEEKDENFIIRFEKPGRVDADVSGKNIQSISVLSEDPLTVSVAVPAGAKTRSFPVRSRIVLDVYDPSGVAAAAQAKRLMTRE